MFTQQQQSMMEKIPGMSATGNWQKQQQDMMQSMIAAWMPQMQNSSAAAQKKETVSESESNELSAVKQQLAELMKKVDGL
jgi:hypothetical protein